MRLVLEMKGSDGSNRMDAQSEKNRIVVPLRYKHLIQGWIYSLMPTEDYGDFIHNVGYQADGKRFKMFTFSNLYGRASVEKQNLIFQNRICLEIGSQSEVLIQWLYQKILQNPSLTIGKQKLQVEQMSIQELRPFSGLQTVEVQTISPVTAYQFEGGKFHYYAPGSREFEEIVRQNLIRKDKAFYQEEDLEFSILEILSSKKRVVYFKNTFYIAYDCRMKLKVNYRALSLIWNSGLSNKGSAGFGMVRLLNEQLLYR